MEADAVECRLRRILAQTAGADKLPPTAYWVGDTAAERQVRDNFASGRAARQSANRAARLGLEAIASGDLELAVEMYSIANDFYVAALESRIEPKDIEVFNNGADRRGRHQEMADRNAAMLAAVSAQLPHGLKGKAARAAALKANPDLAAAFSGMTDSGIAKALSRVSKAAK